MPSWTVPFRALADLALPASCAACGLPDASVCRTCRTGVEASLWQGGPRPCAPDPAPDGLPPVMASGRYDGALARLVGAYKDEGRQDCAALLGDLLGDALLQALAASDTAVSALGRASGPVHVVPVPSSRAARRARGRAPLLVLARRAVRGFDERELTVSQLLRLRRRVADQAGLRARARAANLEHALEVRPRRLAAAEGPPCLLVDDVLTTGATLAEAARALRAGGCAVLGAATICATERRSRPSSQYPAIFG